MPSKKHKSIRPMSEINVVPIVDVMLVLLAIFMITTPLLTQGVKISLPQAQAQAITESKTKPVIISVDKFGRYYLNLDIKANVPIAPQTLVDRIAAQLIVDKQQGVERPILVKGDSDANYGKVVQAMVLLQKAGVPNIGLMTTPVQQKIG